MRNPFVPAEKEPGTTQANGTPPGYAIALGREPDKRMFDEGARKQIMQAQAKASQLNPPARP